MFYDPAEKKRDGIFFFKNVLFKTPRSFNSYNNRSYFSLFSACSLVPAVRVSMEGLAFMVRGWVNFPVNAFQKSQCYRLLTITVMLVSVSTSFIV